LAPTVGIAVTRFCYPGGILQIFHRQDQQVLRLPTAASGGLINLQQVSNSSSSAKIIIANRPASFVIVI
jgi:hypothetical protein